MTGLKSKDRVLITGGTGLIGRNLHERLTANGYDAIAIGSKYDLRNWDTVRKVFKEFRPTQVFHLAARVGGIYANYNFKADFYSDNVLINTHVVNACLEANVEYIFAMGTGCAYPKRLEGKELYEEDFLDGLPEPTNDAYAYAKRGLLVHLDALADVGALNYTYCLPANIYGSHDNYHPMHSHVVPGLIRRFHDSKNEGLESVAIWGDGSAKRDFLYIDDCIDAMVLLATEGFAGPVNVATRELISIQTLAEEIKRAIEYPGRIEHDLSYPAGQSERLFDIKKITGLGWVPKHTFTQGIQRTVEWYEAASGNVRER